MAEGFDFSCDLCLIGLRCAFWAWSCGFCRVIFFLYIYIYIYIKEFAVMLKVLVDLLWWMGLIFGDLYGVDAKQWRWVGFLRIAIGGFVDCWRW